MSLILDALKRAERERSAERTPMLAELPRLAGDAPRARPRWRIAAIAVLVVIVGLLAWSFVRRPPPVEVAAEPRVDDMPMEIPAPAPSVIPGTEAVESLDDVTDQPVEEEPAPPVQSAPAPEPSAAAAPRAEPAVPARTPAETAAPPASAAPAESAPPPQVAPQAEIPSTLAQPAPMRTFREMPPAYRADFPAITVEVHIYDRDGARRMVMLNGRRYREGERMSEGPQVVEIERGGIVFEHRGETFLYTLGR